MNRCSRKGFMTAMAVMLAVLLSTFAVEQAHAACNMITFVNHTGCPVKVSIACPGGVVGPLIVPAGGVGVLNVPAACMPFQVRTVVCGAPAVIPPGGCLFNVRVAPNCCADVCFDPVACTVTFTPTAGPCPCN